MALFYSKSTGGFYDDSIHTAAQIPSDAVAITEVQHQALLTGQSAGKLITADANGNPILVDPPAPPLADVQSRSLVALDDAAEVLRGKFITANSGQVATYLLKQNQAAAYKAANYTGTIPGLVQAEADATDKAAKDACDDILAQYDLWCNLAAAIETARRTAKVAVNAATTVDAVNSAVSTAQAAFAQIEAQAGSASVE
jgi:hypothetical protein